MRFYLLIILSAALGFLNCSFDSIFLALSFFNSIVLFCYYLDFYDCLYYECNNVNNFLGALGVYAWNSKIQCVNARP